MCLHGRLAQNTRCAVDTQAIGVQAVALSRVRGLKQFYGPENKLLAKVALSRVRGLKRMPQVYLSWLGSRTLTSAWIETREEVEAEEENAVALSRVRGLKRVPP